MWTSISTAAASTSSTSRVRSQIDALVETDPNAFYTYDEYLEAVETLYELVKLRGESISGQLDGTIPSTSAEQSGSDALIDASHIDLDVMGSMDIGGGGGGFDPGGFGGGSSGTASSGSGGGFDMSQLPEGFDPSDFGGETPGEAAPEETGEAPQESAEPTPEAAASPGGEGAAESSPPSSGGFEAGDMPSFGGLNGTGSASAGGGSALAQYALALAVFVPALLFALLYRRRPRRR